jgi:hypothetical protein
MMKAVTVSILALVTMGGGTQPLREPGALVQQLCRDIPPPPAKRTGGMAFARSIGSLTGRARENAVLDELRRGNVPPFLLELKPVRLSSIGRRGERHEAIIFVMPDYLAVGTNDDFLRVPLGLDAATRVARQFGFTLPTRKMVDIIYEQSSLKLTPQPMKAGPRMSSTAYYVEHQRRIEAQRKGRPLGELVSGHKKDLVLTKRLLTRRGRVAIYGWQRAGGEPIQPLSTVHGARYADYSHGIRLVSTTVIVDGTPRWIFDVLADPDLAAVLTYEGAIRDAGRLMGYEKAEVLSNGRGTTP